MIKVTTLEEIQEQINLQGGLPVFVKFGADWCGPCKMVDNHLNAISEVSPEEYVYKPPTILSVNIDESPELVSKFGVRGVPTMGLVLGDKFVGNPLVGAKPRKDIEQVMQLEYV